MTPTEQDLKAAKRATWRCKACGVTVDACGDVVRGGEETCCENCEHDDTGQATIPIAAEIQAVRAEARQLEGVTETRTRSEVGGPECTANPIFLLLVRVGHKNSQRWDTERVFLTREDATTWATARSYRWPGGWRVYCVCAEGELAATLRGVFGP